MHHVPVMLNEALEHLNIRPGLTYVDATAGAGGHLREIIKTNPHGINLAIDRDLNSLNKLEQSLKGQSKLLHGNYADIKTLLQDIGHSSISGGVLADLGVSSMQLDEADRGFSFLHDGPLDMRMDPSQKLSALDFINNYPEDELADIIYKYGEERQSRRIAKRIVENRPLNTTLELSNIVVRALAKPNFHKGRGNKDQSHPATRTFQALRIAVNNELNSLEKFLNDAVELLEPGARIVIITFHSLEDRLVKQTFKHLASTCICPPGLPICTCNHKKTLDILSRKPLTADNKEVLANPRSRSAKLRVGEKMS